ncbi:MAG: hypothetical protein HETSPECPRED_008852 [Heterodermia speciosa]|uniref:Uncharacterized protein n=1 Tax=Heterodermia speciosa TaxID=116794 RepID=A0A8H3ID27_9LECA|nr:MAG: hypothetical protein HETSPECPRED_008852 [Heterodermia speciosa]
MRYSIAATALMAGAVTAIPALQAGGYGASQIGDGQVQVPTSVPSYGYGPETTPAVPETTPAPYVPETTPTPYVPSTTEESPEVTKYSTQHVTIISCHSTVKNCPASSTVVSTSLVPVVPTYPATTPETTPVYVPSTTEVSTPVVVPTTPVYVPTTPVVVPTTPVYVPTTPVVPVVPIGTAPSVPISYPVGTAPSVPISYPVGTAPIPVGTAPVPVPIESSVGNSPYGNTSPVAPYPVASTPLSPIGATGSPIVPVPIPTGTIGTSGYITGPQPTGSPIAFTGAASTVRNSMAVAGLAAFAAIFLA